jgi:hypothetical protein
MHAAGPTHRPGALGARRRSEAPPASFQRKIASSGYGLTYPKQQLGKAAPKPLPSQRAGSGGSRQAAQQAASMRRQLVGAVALPTGACAAQQPPTVPRVRLQAAQAALTCIAVAADGSRLLAGSAAGSLSVLTSALCG